jgi:maltooligosyltrehalose trehalohydrolase
MGEEWAASTRWPFFTSHPQPELAEVTGKGRVEEFADHGWDVTQMIDPQDPAAYREAILNWNEPAETEHANVLALYRSLLALRAREPDLRDPDLTRVRVRYDDGERWIAVERGRFVVVANLSDRARTVPAPVSATVLATDSVTVGADTVTLAPESAAVFAR